MFGFRSLSALSGAQTKIPELPPDWRCRHWATSSKFVTGFFVRVTPTGCPVQCATPSFQVQVSASRLTLAKSSWPELAPPRPGAVDEGAGSRGRLVGETERRDQGQASGDPQDHTNESWRFHVSNLSEAEDAIRGSDRDGRENS